MSLTDIFSDSLYCLANVYLAVLYYTTGHYQKAVGHCTLVTRSRDHSRCRSCVQEELLPKIDDDVDNNLGLIVFYQYIRTAMLAEEQQRRHVIVFTTELFAYYLHIRCMLATKCQQVTKKSFTDEIRQYRNCVCKLPNIYITDVVLFISANRAKYSPDDRRKTTVKSQTKPLRVLPHELDIPVLVGLLQKCAIEHLTKFRQVEKREFGSEVRLVTTDYEALYAYKRGEYRRCLQLSTDNVRALIDGDKAISCVFLFSVFLQLMDDDIVSLTGLALLAYPSYIKEHPDEMSVNQLSLSLYLVTQCKIKLGLRHSVTSLARTLDYVKVARRRLHQYDTMDQLLLKLIEQKLVRTNGL